MRMAGQSLQRASWSAPTGGNRCAGEAAGIEVKRRDLDQAALTFNIAIRGRIEISRPSFIPRKVPASSCRCPAIAAAWCGSPRRGSRAADRL